MNRNNFIKLFVFCALLFTVNGCAYYKAMDIQKQRQAVIGANLVQVNNITKAQETDKLKLEKEIVSFELDVSTLDKEIAKIKIKTKKAKVDNMKKAQKAYNKQLKVLMNKKSALQHEISENNAIIETL